jgi:hypothetical protein
MFGVMSEAIRPALEPGQWKERRSGPISLDVIENAEYVVIEGPHGETVTVSGVDEIFALISLANDALPRDDPRKITHSWLARVEAIRDMLIALASEGDRQLEAERRQLARGWDQMAQVLSAILPPQDEADAEDDGDFSENR